MADACGVGKGKNSRRFPVADFQFFSVSSVLSVAECLFRVVRVPRSREGKISRVTGGISFFFVVFPRLRGGRLCSSWLKDLDSRLRGNDCMKACLRRG